MPALKRQVARTLISILNQSGAARWHRRSSATIFCYHNVVPDTLHVPGAEQNLHAPLSEFEQQLDWIRENFTAVSLGELTDRMERKQPIGGLAALTFDDCYTGVIRNAVPAMRERRFPFTLLPVVRNATDRIPFWWDLFATLTDREREENTTARQGDPDLIFPQGLPAPALPDDMLPASWDMLRAMLADDATIGVHGVTHRNLSAIKPDQISWELARSRERIGEELGVVADTVAYPYGRSNPHVVSETKRLGFRSGLGIQYGILRSVSNLHNVARVNVPAGIPLPNFVCWASGLKRTR